MHVDDDDEDAIILCFKNHLSQLCHFLCCSKSNKNIHAAMLPVRAECSELTTSKRKGDVAFICPFPPPRHTIRSPEAIIREPTLTSCFLQSAFKSSHP